MPQQSTPSRARPGTPPAPRPQVRLSPGALFRSSQAAPAAHPGSAGGADELLRSGYRAADRVSFWLLLGHVPLILALAFLRDTWTEALFWGGGAVAAGMFAAWRWRGTLASRLAVATALLVISALIIHQTGGMIEMHFHIFGILAYLLLYRDWRVPVWGAVVVAAHHAAFNVAQTSGVDLVVFQHHTGWLIVAVHAAWVVFEVAILVSMARFLAGETRQAEALMRLAAQVGEGDLMARAEHGAGAVGVAAEAINAGTARLADAVRTVRGRSLEVGRVARSFTDATEHVTRAAEDVAAALNQVAAGSQEQARHTELIATALAGMSRSVDEVAQHAHGVSGASEHAMQVARDGSRVIGDAVVSIERIRATVLESARQIEELRGYSERVGRVTEVIREMAEQTNLLALNAAIEAARAGEQGRGFAVVAEEVRKLATQSGDSAREATALILGVQQVTERIVSSMERGTAEVRSGAELAANAGSAVGEILSVVEQTVADVSAITRAAGEIGAGSREALARAGLDAALATGAEGAGRSLGSIISESQSHAAAAESAAASVQQINAAMEEVSASAEELAEIARALQAEVARFRVSAADEADPEAAPALAAAG